MSLNIKIKENSGLAKIAAQKLKTSNAAMVIGNTIYLYGVSKVEFLRSEGWLNHELKHVEQYLRYGTLYFLFLYLIESFRKGYYNNRFEVEARMAEHQPSLLRKYLK
jgi:hypothetical protein